jgi:2-keto-4-pentenoate hydratase/2-oxohepta-3-ene-1,7-dioic acid hydratase in catechol pathway
MKIVRFKKCGFEKTGILQDYRINELSCSMNDIFNKSNVDGFKKEGCIHELSEIKILPPVIPTKIICVGLNYRDHAWELNMELPDEPVLFLKPPTSIIGR